IFELMLQLGLDLSSPVLIREAAGKLLYAVGTGEIIACLADDIGHDDVEPLADGVLSLRQELDHDDAATFIIKDSSFSDDVAKINLVSLLEQAGLSRIR